MGFSIFGLERLLNIRYEITVLENESIKSSFYARHYAKCLGFNNVFKKMSFSFTETVFM